MTRYAPVAATGQLNADVTGSGGPARSARIMDPPRFEITRDWLVSGGSVLIFGGPGSGKSTLLDTVLAAAGRPRVLRCTPPEAAADLPFFALADLLSSVAEAELARLPTVQRRVLTSVVRRAHTAAAEATPAVTRLATLQLLRTLAKAGPVWLVVDDLHRLDQATADLLRFVAVRVDDVPVRMAAAERVPDNCSPLGRSLCPAPLLMVGVNAVALPGS